MLSRSRRLSTKLFKEVVEKGHVFHSPFFVVKIEKGEESSRFGVSVPIKVVKMIVKRNHLKRQIYSVIHHLESKIYPNFLVVLIVKPSVLELDFDHLREEIEKTFVKTGIIK